MFGTAYNDKFFFCLCFFFYLTTLMDTGNREKKYSGTEIIYFNCYNGF